MDRHSDTTQFIKARWIRPEDMRVYEEIGFDYFKISGRSQSTSWLLNAAKAYSSRQYQGNLRDILSIADPTTKYVDLLSSQAQTSSANPSPYLEFLMREDFRSFLQSQPPRVYINNKALDGFIDFFKDKDCLSGCSHCNYCRKIADKVVELNPSEVNDYVSILNKFLDALTSREFIPASTLPLLEFPAKQGQVRW